MKCYNFGDGPWNSIDNKQVKFLKCHFRELKLLFLGAKRALLDSLYVLLFDFPSAIEKNNIYSFWSGIYTKIKPIAAQAHPVEMLLALDLFYICSEWINLEGFKTVKNSFLFLCLKSEDVCFCRI